MSKRRVWLSQINNSFGRGVFAPYSVGLLVAYAKTKPDLVDAYDFAGFVYLREDIDQIVARMGRIDVLGISAYTWNWEISKALAKRTKEANPDCLIVMGGPHVPTRDDKFFEKHSYVDVAIHSEGEIAFSEVLLKQANGERPRGVFKGDRVTDLDALPSPYLTGVFDELVKDDRYDWQITQETHRGCPFSCT